MRAKIEKIGGIPTIVVNDTPIPEMAYITYRPEENRYSDFADAGVKLFSVNLNFSEQPINERAPVLVFQKGIFEQDTPDFTIVDQNFDQILTACPDAYIFPRVNINLPRSWEETHPEELCEKGFGDRTRFSFASDLWAEDAKKYLSSLVSYIENSKYKYRVIGYQIAAGNTEEWLTIDPQSGYGIRAKEKFDRYCCENDLEKNAENYYTFMSELVASRICEMGSVVKELTGNNKLVGCFYGYSLFVDRTNCHNALGKLLESENVDFLCSPLTYADLREVGIDLYPMVPTASLRHHNKVYFAENDMRTHLSQAIHEHPNYTSAIWFGHEQHLTAEQLKLAFSRGFLYGYGMWWFDMWGGWYADETYMSLFAKMQALCKDGMDTSDADVAVFVDEACICADQKASIPIKKAIRELGLCGTPYDAYLMSDFYEVSKNYKACAFLEPTATPLSVTCKNEGAIPVLQIRDQIPTQKDLRDWLKENGVNVPVNRAAVVYRSKKYISLYTAEDGEYDFCDGGERRFTDLFDGEQITFPTTLPKGKFFLFERPNK